MVTRYRIGGPTIAVILLVGLGVAAAAGTPAQQCQAGKNKLSGKYAGCRAKAEAALATTGDASRHDDTVAKCAAKFADAWSKLEAKATAAGSACPSEGDEAAIDGRTTAYADGVAAAVAGARFEDNGDGTVTDHLTGLQWEKKTSLDDVANAADPHDADNFYTLTATSGGTAPNGTAFTDFIDKLNGGAGPNTCLANQCDWRMPTLEELETILVEPFPCGPRPCIDPTFGPTVQGGYWTATGLQSFPSQVWDVAFSSGFVLSAFRSDISHVRAVRVHF